MTRHLVIMALVGLVVSCASIAAVAITNSYWFDVPNFLGGLTFGVCGSQAFLNWRFH